MNFVFISPNYPDNFWLFCRGLKKYGATVLAIVDTSYDSLKPELKQYVDECYVIKSFHDYEEVFRACAYFSFKYGKIDWIESNNEAWLSLDARLRDDFNVKTGFSYAQIDEFQSKAAMKQYYQKAGVPTAAWCLPENLEQAKEFAKEYGYPLVLKPDHGVGASFTYKLHNDADLELYYQKTRGRSMILEQFIDGDILTLDGICDADGHIRFLASMEYIGNCMDSVQLQDSIGCFYNFEVKDEYWQTAQNVVNAFGLKNRFFHGEYFLLKEDVRGVGPKGTLAGLEVNFRPPGGFCTDLMNYSFDLDVYELWAKIILTQESDWQSVRKYSAGFAGRRSSIDYAYSPEQLQSMYAKEHIITQDLPEAYAQAMGNTTITAKFTTEKDRNEFFKNALMRKETH